jgi:hypothetical protein
MAAVGKVKIQNGRKGPCQKKLKTFPKIKNCIM